MKKVSTLSSLRSETSGSKTTRREKIIIFDTTLRDGEQSPGASLDVKQKLEIAQALKNLGIDVIEAGFPVSSPGDFKSVKLIAKEVKGPQICGLARAVEKDIDSCWQAIREAENPRIHTFIATSDIHLEKKLKKTRAQVLEIAKRAVKYAKKYTANVEFSAEDAVRSNFDYLCQVVRTAIKAGATTINIPDTVGYALPTEFGQLIRKLRERVPELDEVNLSVHCHNDLGLAVANSLTAVVNGARQMECTINGLGERAGNAALEEIVMALVTRKDLLNFTTGIRTQEIYKTSRLVSSLTGILVQPNKAIVGANAFAHEAGIHQDGVLKSSLTYEIMTPQSVGIPESKLVLGKHSGRHALKERLEELGCVVVEEELEKIFTRFKELADRKKYIFDEDLLVLVEEGTAVPRQFFILEYLQITTGTGAVPTATVRIKKEGNTYQEAACGDGPVDACYKAIDKITGIKAQLLDYSLRAISAGKDALGEVTVKISYKKNILFGRGRSTDIIEASAKAYLDTINKIVSLPKKKRLIPERI